MKVEWNLCVGNVWCDLLSMDLSTVSAKGVYLIGYGAQTAIRTVYLGQGDVAERLGGHRCDPEIAGFRDRGPLFATWAVVLQHQIDGVERHVAKELRPILGSRHPDVAPIKVNTPDGWV